MEKEEGKWEDLASDLLVHIFCYLGLEDLIVAVPFVCKSWYESSLDHRCWKNLDFCGLAFYFKSNLERRFKQEYVIVGESFSFSSFMKFCVRRSHGSLVELIIPSFPVAYIKQDLIYASIECPRLKLLALGGDVSYKDGETLVYLISKWKELEILKIEGNPYFMRMILEQISISCPNFIGLHLHGLLGTLDHFTTIVRWIPGLKVLALRGSIISKESLMQILEGCRDLEVLDVSYCAGFDVDDEILMKASKINKFDCERATKKVTWMHHFLLGRSRLSS